MANATQLSNMKVFQWSRPLAPNPRLASPISSTATTITVTNPPLDESDAIITGNFLMGVKNSEGYTETVYVPAGASIDGLTFTGVVRGIRLSGLDYTTSGTSLAAAHNQDSPVYCNIAATHFVQMVAAMKGQIASGGTSWRIGDETDQTITIYAQNADGTKPAWRYNKTTNIWEYSNDGVSFQPFGTGSGLTGGLGININSGAIDVDLTDTNVFVSTSAGAGDTGKVPRLDSTGKLDSSVINTTSINNINSTADTSISSGDAVAYDGIGRLVKADGNDLNPFGLFAGVATSAGTAGNTMTFAGNGVVTVPAFTLADRQNCRLWPGESNATSNTTTDTVASITAWRAQTFIPATGQDNVSRITLNLTNSTLVATGSVQIYAVSGSIPNQIPTGSALATSSDVSSWSTGDIYFDFTTPLAVTPGTSYAIVFRLTAYTSGNIAWNYNNTSVYANGNSGVSSNSGGTWSAEATFDRRFTVSYRGLSGEPVYLSDTAGGFSLTPGTYQALIGTVINSTSIILNTSRKCIYATYSFTDMPVGSIQTTISIGFKPFLVFCSIQDVGGTAVSDGSIGFWIKSSTSLSGCINAVGQTTTPVSTYINGAFMLPYLAYLTHFTTAAKSAIYSTLVLSVVSSSADSITISRYASTNPFYGTVNVKLTILS